MGKNPDRETEILIDYYHGNPLGWRARMFNKRTDIDNPIEILIEGASAIENVTKYLWRLTKNGKL